MAGESDEQLAKGGGYFIESVRLLVVLIVAGEAMMGFGLYEDFFASGLSVSMKFVSYAVSVVGSVLIILAIIVLWDGTVARPRAAGRLVKEIAWGGDEVVLNLGCGRGTVLALSSRSLNDGYSIGIDTWQHSKAPNEEPRRILAVNSKEPGKVLTLRGDPGVLPIADDSVDVVLSAFALHRIAGRKERAALFSEIRRVLRDGGKIGILEGGSAADYSKRLADIGMTDVRLRRMTFSSIPPFRLVLARKPFSS